MEMAAPRLRLCRQRASVWLLLQPRDYLNSLLLYLGVGAMYLGFVATNPSFVAPAIDFSPAGAPAMFPFVFVVIACGAASGFHALVSSGTSAKQLASEGDARLVGYGAMIGESVLGLMAVLACTAGSSRATRGSSVTSVASGRWPREQHCGIRERHDPLSPDAWDSGGGGWDLRRRGSRVVRAHVARFGDALTPLQRVGNGATRSRSTSSPTVSRRLASP